MGALLSIEEVLAAEVEAIHGPDARVATIDGPGERVHLAPAKQEAQDERKRLNADRRERRQLPSEEVERRERFYRSLNHLNRAALCFSGGGIRSATFCLGVLQALADYDVTNPARGAPRATAETGADPHADAAPSSAAPADASPPSTEKEPAIDPKNSLLGRIDFLSTVSGGGYIGSWLSSWRMRDDFATVIRNLTARPDGADVEPAEISWLRAYSNYLTPRIGIGSADTWAAVAIFTRNLVLNWIVIVPIVCIVLLGLKLIATVSVGGARHAEPYWIVALAVIGAAFLMAAQAFTTHHRPTRRQRPGADPPAQTDNVKDHVLLSAILFGLSSRRFWSPLYLRRALVWAGLAMARRSKLSV